MNNTIEYKGYVGTIEFSKTDKVFYGKVLDTKALCLKLYHKILYQFLKIQ